MGLITKSWRYLLIFFVLFAGGLWQINWDQKYLFAESDSTGYSLVAYDISNFELPILSVRTPTYPLLLSPLVKINKLGWMMYFSVFFGAIGGMVMLWVVDKISVNKRINLFLILFIWMDYGVINFRSMLMTESIAPTMMILMLGANIFWLISDGKKGWQLVLIADILTGFLKPIFIILPLILKLFFGLITYRICSVKLKKSIFFKAVTWSLLIITVLPIYNFITGHGLQLSEVAKVNTLGIIMKNGYLDMDIGNPPPNVAKAVSIFRKEKNIENVWQYMRLIKKGVGGVSLMKVVDEMDNYFISRNLFNYLVKTLETIPEITTNVREYNIYVPPKAGLGDNIFFKLLEYCHGYLNSFKWIALLVNTVVLLFFWYKKDKKIIVLGAMVIISWIILIGISAFSMGEYYRLRQPIDPILEWLIFYPFLALLLVISQKRNQNIVG